MLLHLHGVGPICLTLENQNVHEFRVASDLLRCHRLRHVDVLFVLLLRLSKLQRFSKSEHSTAAVFVITTIIVMAQTILVLSCLHKK